MIISEAMVAKAIVAKILVIAEVLDPPLLVVVLRLHMDHLLLLLVIIVMAVGILADNALLLDLHLKPMLSILT